MMKTPGRARGMYWRCLGLAAAILATMWSGKNSVGDEPSSRIERRLYVAVPGIRNYLEYGGHGLLVYDIDHGHRLIKRIPTAGARPQGSSQQRQGDLRECRHEAPLHQHDPAAHVR